MKKIALILLICIYSLATMGFSLKQFYCCGKLKSTTFSLIQEAQQHCNDGEKQSGCCDYKYQFFKVKDKHVTADEVNNFGKPFIYNPLYISSSQNISLASQTPSIAYRSNAPPLRKNIPAYIYNCVFRI